jgi:hypothetical protein
MSRGLISGAKFTWRSLFKFIVPATAAAPRQHVIRITIISRSTLVLGYKHVCAAQRSRERASRCRFRRDAASETGSAISRKRERRVRILVASVIGVITARQISMVMPRRTRGRVATRPPSYGFPVHV